MQTQYERLSDAQWENIKEYLPTKRKQKYDLRDVVDAIFWMLRIGSQWRNLPETFPPWQSVYYYFRRWKSDDTLQKLNEALNKKERVRQGKEPTPSMLNIDSQFAKAAPFVSQNKGVDGNKRVNGLKRHIITDTLGLVWFVVVHAANLADGSMGEQVVNPLIGYLHRLKKILTDAAYKKKFRDWVYEQLLGVDLELSSKPPSTKGFVPTQMAMGG
ncbi:MAG: IS5 family transposase [Mameliella sp.]|nr:IS5 family transposase [Phaeodactylibacter sp.]